MYVLTAMMSLPVSVLIFSKYAGTSTSNIHTPSREPFATAPQLEFGYWRSHSSIWAESVVAEFWKPGRNASFEFGRNGVTGIPNAAVGSAMSRKKLIWPHE